MQISTLQDLLHNPTQYTTREGVGGRIGVRKEKRSKASRNVWWVKGVVNDRRK